MTTTFSFPGSAVFNEGGLDADFRVESDTNTHALFVEGTNSNVKIVVNKYFKDLELAGLVATEARSLYHGAYAKV